jgi:type IV pilus assembly protein PilX
MITGMRRRAYGRARPTRARGRQQGAVLILGLVILLVVTMVGISGQQSTVLQERMAGNMRQNNVALQAAEAALQVGLAYVDEQHDLHGAISATDSGADFVWTPCTVADAQAPESTATDPCTRIEGVLANWRGRADDLSRGAPYADVAALTSAGYGGPFPGVVAQPRLYIEARKDTLDEDALDAQMQSWGVLTYYTVTAVGFGGNEQARAIVQSTIAKPPVRP